MPTTLLRGVLHAAARHVRALGGRPREPFVDPRQAHACLDLETLSLRVDATILSIGACSWLAGDKPGTFRKTIELQVNMDQPGRRIDAGTIAWWAMQSDEARARAFGDAANGVEAPTLAQALAQLKEWLDTLHDPMVWTNDPSFDAAIVNHANDGDLLWYYRNTRCCRTAADCVTDAEYDALKEELKTASHAPLDDAKLSGAVVQTYLLKTAALRGER